MWEGRKFNSRLPIGGPGHPPEWCYLGGPGAETKEQAYRYGEHRDLAGFKRFALGYADGRYYAVLYAAYEKGLAGE